MIQIVAVKQLLKTMHSYERTRLCVMESVTFAGYVSSMPRDEFTKILNSEYVYIQGKCTSHKPLLDIRASVEFSLALLLEKYISDRLPEETNRYAPLIINLADLLGCAFMGMPDYEWSQMLNTMLTSYNNLIPYTEWFDIFRLAESEYRNVIASMPFSYGNNMVAYMSEISANRKFYREVFVPKYNSMRSYADTLNYYKSAGLRLFDSITVTP